jgi:Tol biopolymer transport system component
LVGRQLGRYRILEKLGSGGMGEVWRARDESLDRDVALKILPASAAADPERRQRFEREAKAVAGLQHPNIVTLHSIEEADGEHFLTMELVRGKTLGRLLPAEGLPLERIFELGIPLADAVHAAHEQGVIHRDLKPGNVMVDDGGRLRVLDFGLAKLVAAAGDGADGKTLAGGDSTQQGQILGTVAYMSPEQAEGKPLDRRSDIFSLGVVLYEMATGKRPFEGDTPISTMSAILKETPPSVTSLKPLPRHLGRIIQRCLEKNPDRRFQTARDVCNELEGLQREVESGEVESVSGMSASALGLPPAAAPKRSPWPWIAGVGVVAAAVVAAVFLQGRRTEAPAGRQVVARPLTGSVGVEYAGSFSPDGAFFCYSHCANGPLDVFVQSTTGGDPIRLVESPGDDTVGGWSPDNRWIAFVSNRGGSVGVYLIPPLGGTIRKIADVGVGPLAEEGGYALGPSPWSPDGKRIAYARMEEGSFGVWVQDLDSGRETRLSDPKDEGRDGKPAWSFDGKWIAYLRQSGIGMSLRVVSAEGGSDREVHADRNLGTSFGWSPDSRSLVFAAGTGEGGSQSIQVIDLETGSIRSVTAGTTDLGEFSVGRDGRILYGDFSHQTDLYVRTMDGREERRLTFHTQSNFGARFSPGGDRIAYQSDRTGGAEIWVLDLESGKELRITDDDAEDWAPTWSPDGARLAFASVRSGVTKVWVAPASGGPAREVDGPEGWLAHWASDGTGIGVLASAEGGTGLWVVGPDGESEPRLLLERVRDFGWWRDSRIVIYTAFGAEDRILARDLKTGRETLLLDAPNTEIAVAPDGSALTYCAAESHFNMNLRLLRLEEGEDGLPRAVGSPEAITAGDGEWHVHNGGWSPDGKSVVYTRDTDTGDLFLLEGAF